MEAAAATLPSSDLKDVLAKLALSHFHEKLSSNGITLEHAQKLGKAPLLAALNHIGVPESDSVNLASVIFPGTPTLPAVQTSSQPPSSTTKPTKTKAPLDQYASRVPRLKLGDQLAKSTLATVHRGTLKGESVVIKFYHGVGEEKDEELRKELESIQRLSHPNVVRVLSFIYAPPPCVVSPFIARCDLRAHLNRSGPLEAKEALSMTLSIAKGLEYIHQSGIIHRDLNSSNVFLNEKLEPLVGDFGLASVTAARTRTLKSASLDSDTPRWMAPEMIRGEQYTNAVDVYSFGIVIWELLDGSTPYSQSYATIEVILAAVLRGERPLKGTRHTGLLSEVMESCWVEDAPKRPTMKQVIRLLDPNAPAEVIASTASYGTAAGALAFKAGDKVTVLRELPDNWLEGEANGKRGRFPSFCIAATNDVRRAAEEGNAAAQFDLGRRYELATGIEKNDREAVKWYRKAADQGHANAQYDLAVCYAHGTGVEKDEREAMNWYRKAADQGHARAQFFLGRCYELGHGVAKDALKAFKCYQKAADLGDSHAQFSLALCYENGTAVARNQQEAVKWYRKAADQGNPIAQCNLGHCFANGLGIQKDEREAVKWYRISAEQDDPSAQYSLGFCYDHGQGVEKNEREAVKWYLKAAEQGDTSAQFALGLSYSMGQGVEKNEREAAKWYRMAAREGHAEAQHNLGVRYLYGKGVLQDEQEAAKWISKAAVQGFPMAQQSLGEFYEAGVGVARNKQEAVKWYRRAAEQGDDLAQYNLGLCYERGKGVEKNDREAMKWYRKAADQGHSEAHIRLNAMRMT